jgi:hypothetical protein
LIVRGADPKLSFAHGAVDFKWCAFAQCFDQLTRVSAISEIYPGKLTLISRSWLRNEAVRPTSNVSRHITHRPDERR